MALDLPVQAPQAFELAPAQLALVLLGRGCPGGGLGDLIGGVCRRGARLLWFAPWLNAVARRGAGRVVTLKQLADHRVVGTGRKGGLERVLGEAGTVLGEHQYVSVVVVFKMKVDAFLFAQPMQQVQVGFVVLDAQRPRWVLAMVQFEAVTVGGQAALLEQLVQQLRHAQLTPYTPPWRLLQGEQAGGEGQAVRDLLGVGIDQPGALDDPVAADTRPQAR